MPPKWGPCGAASGWRKSPKGRAQDAREVAARTRMCAQRPPEPARELGGQDARRARHRGVFLLVTFLCTSKEKLPARPQAEWKPRTSKNDQVGLQATPVACPSGHSLRECS